MRMIMISDADLMNIQAQNALLKMLEEPPEKTFFILTATRISSLASTIISRCRQIRFRPLNCRDIEKNLTERFKADRQKAYIASNTADSDFKKALMYLNLSEQETDWIERRKWLIEEFLGIIENRGAAGTYKGLVMSQKLEKEPLLLADSVRIIKTLIRDLSVFRYNPERIVNVDFFDSFKDINQIYDHNIFFEWIKDLHETEKRLESNAAIRLTLDKFFLKLSLAKEI